MLRTIYLPIACLCTGRAHDNGRLLLSDSDVHERKTGSASARNNRIASGLMHPACKFVPWKGKVVCAEGVDADAVVEVVRTRHVPPRTPSSHATSDTQVSMEHRFDGVMQAIENANARAMNINLRVNRENDSSSKGEQGSQRMQHRVAVLMTGLIARDAGRQERCTMRGKQRQLIATRSQIQHVFGPLQSAGFRVVLFLATPTCNVLSQSLSGDRGSSSSSGPHDNFTDTLAHAYRPWLADFRVASCDQVGLSPKLSFLIKLAALWVRIDIRNPLCKN